MLVAIPLGARVPSGSLSIGKDSMLGTSWPEAPGLATVREAAL